MCWGSVSGRADLKLLVGRRVVGEAGTSRTGTVCGGRRSGSEAEGGRGAGVSLGKAQLKVQFDSTGEAAKVFGQDVT